MPALRSLSAWMRWVSFHTPSPRYVDPARRGVLLIPATADLQGDSVVNMPSASMNRRLTASMSCSFVATSRRLSSPAGSIACAGHIADEALYAAAILLDAWDKSVYGGTGTSFDWAAVPDNAARPLILAGGLTPENVGAAIRRTRPYAVDVSGGIEVGKGVKDHEKMQRFVTEVHNVECHP